MSEWQDIETAPKDGRWIVVFCPNYSEDQVRPASFQRDVGLDQDIWDFSGETYEYVNSEDAPTHWQPLPPPPTHNPEKEE